MASLYVCLLSCLHPSASLRHLYNLWSISSIITRGRQNEQSSVLSSVKLLLSTEMVDSIKWFVYQSVRSECLQLQQRVEQLERQNHRLQLLVQQTFSSLTYSTLQVSFNSHMNGYSLGLFFYCIQCEAKKTAPLHFCNNFIKSFFIGIIIGTHIP